MWQPITVECSTICSQISESFCEVATCGILKKGALKISQN